MLVYKFKWAMLTSVPFFQLCWLTGSNENGTNTKQHRSCCTHQHPQGYQRTITRKTGKVCEGHQRKGVHRYYSDPSK